nr:MAG TPA_asm: hypothetical protein [Caudoviricetes sp.]
MYTTERTALADLLQELKQERQDLRREYRERSAELDRKQQEIIQRLSQLDERDNERIDPQAIIESLNRTAQDLGALIPSVPIGDVIERTAAMLADKAKENGTEITYRDQQTAEREQAEEKAAAARAADMQAGAGKMRADIPLVLEKIEEIIIEKGEPLRPGQIEVELKERYGWHWRCFSTSFSQWRKSYPGAHSITNYSKAKYIVTTQGEIS